MKQPLSKAKAQEQVISDLWQRIYDDLERLEQEYVTLHKLLEQELDAAGKA